MIPLNWLKQSCRPIMKCYGENEETMSMNPSRRDVLKLIGATGAVLAVSEIYAAFNGDSTVEAASSITPLLRYYLADARNNVVWKNRRRAMLSSHVYPKATFVRDSFYGPLALNDVNLSAECYRWFAEMQNPATGQIRCAVPFDPKNEFLFQIWDDDSSLLFVIWAAWLKRNRVPIDQTIVERAWSFIQTHVQN